MVNRHNQYSKKQTYLQTVNFQELDVGLANGIRAMNITHTGELGYVLYIPNEVCANDI